MIRVEANRRQIAQAADNLAKQVRYATAVALTRTAQDAQAEVRRRLPERFTIRTGWVAKGIRIKPAKKSDLQASVRVLDPFMAMQETGGSKRSQTGDALGVPVGARPNPKSVTRPGKFPGALLKKPNHFIAPLHDDPSTYAVWRRSGRKGRKLKMMYLFADRVEIKPRFGFMDTVKAVVEARFQENFGRAMEEAFSTSTL
ncbi:hypothetical protein Mmc1_1247 [Magnetococcus marinus MC-1]|uniref:Phage protein, HK97 gp10 family n=1 Tax=Magnetococcus marinus (strain ATCC BAA-1437 / JCM 17883 / MC-1) TaxID=156889 RepID=A0L715_MAGMM|nr:hypothetical protein [Magnetococcus marinus]ABK43758.1 hypothetical protein Mmc1_1247 [Magnetococcus marinus MC-1]